MPDTVQSETSQPMSGVESLWSQTPSESKTEHSEAPQQSTTIEKTQQPAQQAATKPTEGQGQVTPEIRQQAAQQGIDPQQLANAIVQAQMQAQQQAKANEQPQYTKEQFNQEFGVFEVDKKQYDALFGVDSSDEQIQMFNQIIRKTANMAVKMAEYRSKQHIESLQKQINPALTTVQDINRRAIENKFAQRHPALVRHKPLVDSVVAQMVQQGIKFPNPEAAMDAAAIRAKQVLQQSGVNLEQVPQTGQQAPTQTPARPPQRARPATASTGGGGGTGGSGSSTQKSSVQRLWG